MTEADEEMIRLLREVSLRVGAIRSLLVMWTVIAFLGIGIAALAIVSAANETQ